MQNLIVKGMIARTMVRDSRLVVCSFPAMRFSGPLNNKEKGDEKQFFNKEDEKVLKDLLKKMQAQNKQAAAPVEENAEKSAAALKKLFKAHKLNETEHKGFFDALIDWKKQ